MSPPDPLRAVTLPVEALDDRVRVRIRVVPRASRTEAAGRHGDAFRVRVAAPPVDGKANAALVEYLARALAVPKSAVRIVRGDTARTKTVEVRGDPDHLATALAALAGGARA